MARRWIVLALLPLMALVLTRCSESYSWRQKMTVTVETPEGAKSASSVVKVTWEHLKTVPGFPAGRARNTLKGEAVVLEVKLGRYLFALLGGADTLAQYVVLDDSFRGTPMKTRGDALEDTGRSGEIPPKLYPLLVTFADIADPASVERVDPDGLAATFGPGYALKSITLETTDEPMTEGRVEQVLGDLKAIGRLRPTLIPNPPRLSTELTDPQMQTLTVGAFKADIYR